MAKREDLIFTLTGELHDDVTNIYEATVDGNNKAAFGQIDDLRRKLKALKDNLIKKDEV